MDVHRFANINSLKNIYSDRIPRSVSTTAIQVNVIVHLCLCYLWEIEYSLLHKNERVQNLIVVADSDFC